MDGLTLYISSLNFQRTVHTPDIPEVFYNIDIIAI